MSQSIQQSTLESATTITPSSLKLASSTRKVAEAKKTKKEEVKKEETVSQPEIYFSFSGIAG